MNIHIVLTKTDIGIRKTAPQNKKKDRAVRLISINQPKPRIDANYFSIQAADS